MIDQSGFVYLPWLENTIRISKEGANPKRIKEDKFEKYQEAGWSRGRK